MHSQFELLARSTVVVALSSGHDKQDSDFASEYVPAKQSVHIVALEEPDSRFLPASQFQQRVSSLPISVLYVPAGHSVQV